MMEILIAGYRVVFGFLCSVLRRWDELVWGKSVEVACINQSLELVFYFIFFGV